MRALGGSPRLARRLGRLARSAAVWQGVAGIVLFIALWQLGSMLRLPMLRHVPSPLDVLAQLAEVVQGRQYWLSWYVSGQRVFLGYAIGVGLGVPLGLAMGMNRIFHGLSFPL